MKEKLEHPILVLLGKSGAGKDRVQTSMINLYLYDPIISHSTRPMREGESERNPYYFISNEEMMEMKEKDELIELRSYDTIVDGNPETWYYAVAKKEIERAIGMERIVVLDALGLKDFTEYFGKENIISVYIHVDDEIREERAKKRGSFCSEEWKRRLEADRKDFQGVKTDIVLNNNEDSSMWDVAKELSHKINVALSLK